LLVVFWSLEKLPVDSHHEDVDFNSPTARWLILPISQEGVEWFFSQ
jgi:hypothetical protein